MGPTLTTTARTTTSTKTTSQVNNYDYNDYNEESNPIIVQTENTTNQIITNDVAVNLTLEEIAKIFDGGVFEKDIVLTVNQAFRIFSNSLNDSQSTRQKRQILNVDEYYPNRYNIPDVSNSSLWSQEPTIVYMFDDSYSSNEKSIIKQALDKWQEKTCVTFVETQTPTSGFHYLRFTKGDRSFTGIGKFYSYPYNGYQDVSVGNDSLSGEFSVGKVCHLIGHVLGFFHEQSRPDREDYVKINYMNIQPTKIINFQYYSSSVISTFSFPYDYSSIMHFGQSEYSRDPYYELITINTTNPSYSYTIGQRVGLSYMDVKKANYVYCKNKCAGVSLSCQRNGYINPKTCNSCICPDGFTGQLCEQLNNQTCGGVIVARPSNAPTSLNTPNSYSNNNNGPVCAWQIQVPPTTGSRNLTYPRISFLNFLNLTTSCDISNYNKTCGSDWVEVRSVSNQLDLGGPRYCCSSVPSQIVSSSNETIVLFYSSGLLTQSKGGFAAKTYYAIKDCPNNTFVNATANGCEECPSNSFFGNLCNLSPCQCGTSNGLICQSGVCSCGSNKFWNNSTKNCESCPIIGQYNSSCALSPCLCGRTDGLLCISQTCV